MAAASSARPSRLLPEATLARLALDFEVGFFEAALPHDPDNLGALESLGNAYSTRGRHAQGLEIDRRLVRLLPRNAIAHYNLACSLSILGKVDEAIGALERALELGYSDMAYLERDPDLENVRRHARYRTLVKARR